MLLVDDLLVWLPGKGLMWVFKQVYDHSMAEWRDPVRIKQQLFEAQFLYEANEITLEEYEKQEQQLLSRLSEAADEESSGDDED